MLIPSSRYFVKLTYEVNAKAREMVERLTRQQDYIVLPVDARNLMVRLVERYAAGDLRHTEHEMLAVERIAHWCHEMWEKLGHAYDPHWTMVRARCDGTKNPRPKGNPFRPKKVRIGGRTHYITYDVDGNAE